MFEVAKKVVFVTGGTRGIGLALAKGFSEKGAFVLIHGHDEEATKAVAAAHGFFGYIAGDLRNVGNVRNIAERLANQVGCMDVLINNAGLEKHAAVDDMNPDVLEDSLNVNAKAPAMIVKSCIPLLKKSSYPSIINITSIHQTVPSKTNSAYCMSKAALEMYTKVAALELAKDGIRVNSIAPGAILTDINREIVGRMSFEDWIPLGRVGDAKEIVGPAIFLASEAASYMTGSTLYVDGGYKENLLRY